MTKLDLSQCELEPVRYIGSIQPFGAILICDNNSVITHASLNIDQFLKVSSQELIGKYLRDIKIEGNFRVCKKKLSQNLLIEIEPEAPLKHIDLNTCLGKIQNTTDLKSLLQKTADAVYEITKYDRVMIYKFHDDFHGEVVAEAVVPGVDSFMGLHYPASDIPSQARAIFLENWVRIIPDVHAVPARIVGQEVTGIDLGKVSMRAVSPIHIEYLKNMEVGASLTISIIVENKLWGLIACHHSEAKYVDYLIREAVETLGRMTSTMIRESEIKEIHLQGQKLKKDIYHLQTRLENAQDIGEELTKSNPNLVELIPSNGAAAALYMEGYWATVGNVPDEDQLSRLVSWLSQNMNDEVFATHELPAIYPEALKYKKVASGLLAASIPKTKNNFILWFRPEVIETVRWAGNPDKIVDTVNGRLTPRASFEEWKVSVEAKSIPWKIWEINAALDIKHAVISNDLKRQYDKEKKARHEAELAKQAREELMAVVSHDLKNPLSSITMNIQLLKRFLDSADDKSKEMIDRIGRSAKAMNNLIEDILNVTKLEAGQFELEYKKIHIRELLEESIEMLHPLAQEKRIRLELSSDAHNCIVQLDYGRMLQVISNIIGNAIKFTPEGGEIISSILKCGPDSVILSIKDSGPGIPKENLENIFDRFWQAKEAKRLGTGLGLAIVKGIVEKHHGEIWAESKLGEGTTFLIKLPLTHSAE